MKDRFGSGPGSVLWLVKWPVSLAIVVLLLLALILPEATLACCRQGPG